MPCFHRFVARLTPSSAILHYCDVFFVEAPNVISQRRSLAVAPLDTMSGEKGAGRKPNASKWSATDDIVVDDNGISMSSWIDDSILNFDFAI